MSRFLLSGLPRMRSAWLAALFSGDGVATFHDLHSVPGGLTSALDYGAALEMVVGVCDPCAASVWPRETLREFEGFPTVYVDRPDWRESTQRWFQLSDVALDLFAKNAEVFKAHAGMVVSFADLDDAATVERIYRYCVGRDLSRQKFELFRYLNIQQNTKRVLNTMNDSQRVS